MIKQTILLLLSVFFILKSNAQIDRETIVTDEQPVIQVKTQNKLYGKLIDAATNKGIGAASVQLFTHGWNDTLQKSVNNIVAAMLTKPNGDFNFENIPAVDSLYLQISATGYEVRNEYLSFADVISGLVVNRNKAIQKDLGNIGLKQDIKSLGMVTILSEKPAMEMGVDKRIYSADKILTAKGGTAIDLMKNIPSVSVDVDGNVELRNTAPQIFIDGRPTILTLDQIPADNIDRVELITNPSAKYDAASSGGIINVILKKNKRVGLNGLASIGAGYPDIATANVNLNLRQGKFNFFTSGNLNQSGGKAKGESLRQNKQNGTIQNYFNQYSNNDRLRRFGSVRFGVDYFLDNRNTITISEHLVKGRFTNDENQDQEYLNNNKILERLGKRTSYGKYAFDRYSTQLNYTHKFPTEARQLDASIDYNYGDGNDFSNIYNTYTNPNGSEYAPATEVRNSGSNNNDQVTVKVDYTSPVGENSKIETGVRSYVNSFQSTLDVHAIKNGAEIKLPLSSNYKYREMVNAVYFTYTGKLKSIGYQAGLRAEQSKFDGELLDSAKKFGYEYPSKLSNIWDALFPSLYLTKELSDDEQMQLNYSRRIRRPGFWNLNPFVDINDPQNIRQGNPALKPEYTNSLEFNYTKTFKDKSNFFGAIYYRNNQGDITRYSDTITTAQYEQLNNAGIDPNAIVNTFINAQSTNRLGVELTLQKKIGKNFDITPTVNLQYRKVNANLGDLDLSNEGFNWEGKLIVNYKTSTKNPSFFDKWGLQAIGEYESPEVVPQGSRKAEYSVDFALRRDFLKDDKASFTFSINDVFNTQRFGSIYDTENFYQESFRRRNVRSFRVTLSYKFGDANFNLFRKNSPERSMDDDS